MSFNILFTSVGRRVELLRAFRRAYQALGFDGRIVAVDMDPLAPALRTADRSYLVPPLRSPDYVAKLAAIFKQEAVDLVFPLIDPDIPALAEHRGELEAGGTRLAVVSVEAAQTAADKWQTYQFFRNLGLATPQSWLPDGPEAGEEAEAHFPRVVKPRFGSASQHVFRVDDAAQLHFFSRHYVPRPMIQEWIDGPEITNDVVCGLDGRLLAVVSRERIRVRSGEVSIGRTVYDPEIAEACARIAAALPAVGPITVQCMMREGRPHYTEINARLGGGLPLAVAAGADVPRWLLAQMAGLDVAIPPLGSYRTGVYLSRFDESLFLTESQCHAVASPGV